MFRLLLEATEIELYFGERKILEIPSLCVFSGDRIGIVGPNGAGKTTLLRILSGDLLPDGGTVSRRCPVSYLRQFGEGPAAPLENDPRLMREFGVSDKIGQTGLSGGEEMRVKLSSVMNEGNLLTFADEPTANLDRKGIELVCEKLGKCETLMLVSHDRDVLDRLCTRILEVKDGAVTSFEGNFTEYQRQSAQKRARQQFEYEQYRAEKSRLEGTLQGLSRKAGRMRKAPSRMGNSEARLHKREATEKEEKVHGARKALESRLEQMEVKEKPRELETARIDFSLTDPPSNKIVLSGKHLSFSYGDRVIFNDASFELPRGSKTALLGDNGSGKTTLFRLITEGFPGITVVPKAKIGYFKQRLEQLDLTKTVLQNACETAVQPQSVMRSILARLLISRDDVGKLASVLSGGERIKLAFAKLFGSPSNLLLLDEPTNFLDLPAIEALQQMIKDYEGTVLFVSHDRAFCDACADRLLRIEDGKLLPFAGNLTAFEEVRQTKTPPSMSKTLLELRLAKVISELSNPSAPDREQLEQQFAELIRMKQQMEG